MSRPRDGYQHPEPDRKLAERDQQMTPLRSTADAHADADLRPDADGDFRPKLRRK